MFPENLVSVKPLPLNALVRVFRESIEGEGAWSNGFVIEQSQELLLLQLINDRISLDGYQLLRQSDITDIEQPMPHHGFIEKALELRQQHPVHPGIVNMSSMESALQSISQSSPLVTIHQESLEPDICWIGRVVSTSQGSLYLKCITPDARFEQDVDSYRIADVSRVDFGGDYEQILWRVAQDGMQDAE
ncbi:MAG: hypothetical protein B0D91_04840 [Oceanospirillales bacterium LUC14_002_19_P2]|nr:MAG: hypothetical protein B0D91_04840 [Oceanospirillales bacterium LUC14_002_19_P2]